MGISQVSGAAVNILLVEDDPELAALVQEYLGKNGFEVQVEANGARAAARILNEQPQLVILDVMLPGMSGMEVCRKLRPGFAGPVLMLTALDDDMDQLLGLELGADDYISKPVVPRLLLARINALLRRARAAPGSFSAAGAGNSTTQVGDLCIRHGSREVLLQGKAVKVTTAEFELLCVLAEAAGQVVERDEILLRVRGFDYDGLDRSIDRRISRLRKKLGDDPDNPQRIKTVRGKGYQLCAI
jgi:DNA-binding response OmpR family regulator